MKKSASKSRSKWLFVLCLACAMAAFGQKHTKSYSESFSVNDDVTIDINTNYTDVEFETWSRDEVQIDAVIEVEGVSEEEAEKYFKGWDFEAMGNSGKVSVTAKSGPRFFSYRNKKDKDNVFFPADAEDMDFEFEFKMPEIEEMPEIEIEPLVLKLKELQELPPMPPMPFNNFEKFSFDYEAYKEEGDEYLERWKKEFTENFDKNFKANLDEWKKKVEEYKKNAEKYRSKIKIDKEKMQKIREAQKKKMSEAREAFRAARKARAEERKDRRANTFYFRGGSGDKNIKVKKTIKIKMPKGAKLKMNVRHGEVKLAENFKNIKATLSHTRLLAARVDGDQTYIEASFSPVSVDYWNKGKLKVNYVKDVALKNVKSVDLSSTSSNVVIGNIINDALIKGSFGKLEIENVANNFNNLDMILDNTDAVIVLPRSAFNFSFNTSNSKINLPRDLLYIEKENITRRNDPVKGFYKQKNSNKNINLTATYSKVVIR